MSGLFGSVTIPGNRLTDLAGQTSTVGKPIPFGYGYCDIEEPNVIWTAGIPKEHVKKKKQGKGGVKTTEYTYTLSYALAFMAGPVYGFLTIKRGGKVVYTTDPNASVDDKLFALKWRQKARFYYGTRTQMPDPTIESYVGVGNVSAFRDLCYIVVIDDDVTNEGGAVPQYEAVIIASPPDIYLTSKPYPNDMAPDMVDRGLSLVGGALRATKQNVYPTEATKPTPSLVEGSLRSPILRPPLAPELMQGTMPTLPPGVLKAGLQRVTLAPETGLKANLPTMISGTLLIKLVRYTYWPAEKVQPSMTLPPGTLGA